MEINVQAVNTMFVCVYLGQQEKEVTITMPNGETSVATVRIWNETVSNLTLMALGSSAPEILLSVIEVHTHMSTAPLFSQLLFLASSILIQYLISFFQSKTLCWICLTIISCREHAVKTKLLINMKLAGKTSRVVFLKFLCLPFVWILVIYISLFPTTHCISPGVRS